LDTSPLERAFSALESSLAADDPDRAPRSEVLRLIRALNQEIGRAAASDHSAVRELRALQLNVNAVTVAVKAGRLREARVALAGASEALREVLKRSPAV